jgi:phospholipid/cholesterol/gamma-HCH transport system permease protein
MLFIQIKTLDGVDMSGDDRVEVPNQRFLTPVKDAFLSVQEFAILGAGVFRRLPKPPFYFRDTINQMDKIGVGSLTIIILTGLFTGMVLALQSAYELETFGAKMYVGRLVAVTMVRELGPVLTALMLSGRIGSGIAAELGSMAVSEQISALKAMGTDPVRKLVIPRVVAGTIMAPLLTVLADFIALVGGLIIAMVFLSLGWSFYWNSVVDALSFTDMFTGLIKPFVFGFIVTLVGCYFGLSTSGGTEGVGRHTTNAVVTASILVLVVDFFMTKFFFAIL